MCDGYEVLINASFVHDQEKTSRGGRRVQWKSAVLQVDMWRMSKAKCPLERRIGIVRKNCIMTVPYYGDF